MTSVKYKGIFKCLIISLLCEFYIVSVTLVFDNYKYFKYLLFYI